MELYKLLLVCLCCFALLNYAILPEVKRRWDSNRSLAKISKASLVGALSFTRTFFLIAAMTYLVVMLVIFVYGLSVGATSEQLKLASEQMQGYRAGLATVQKYFVSWMALILVMVLVYLSYRREKRFIEDQFAKKVEEEKARIQREAEEGKWENLPATPEMMAIVAEIQAAQAAYDALGSNPKYCYSPFVRAGRNSSQQDQGAANTLAHGRH